MNLSLSTSVVTAVETVWNWLVADPVMSTLLLFLLVMFFLVRFWRIVMAPYRDSPDVKPPTAPSRITRDLDCPWEGRIW